MREFAALNIQTQEFGCEFLIKCFGFHLLEQHFIFHFPWIVEVKVISIVLFFPIMVEHVQPSLWKKWLSSELFLQIEDGLAKCIYNPGKPVAPLAVPKEIFNNCSARRISSKVIFREKKASKRKAGCDAPLIPQFNICWSIFSLKTLAESFYNYSHTPFEAEFFTSVDYSLLESSIEWVQPLLEVNLALHLVSPHKLLLCAHIALNSLIALESE